MRRKWKSPRAQLRDRFSFLCVCVFQFLALVQIEKLIYDCFLSRGTRGKRVETKSFDGICTLVSMNRDGKNKSRMDKVGNNKM